MERLTNTFKILSDETRIRILILLYLKKLCVCEICGVLNESQPKVSKHLGKLRDLGFVTDERQEQFIFYSINNNNHTLTSILQHIVDNIKDYPGLAKDIEQLIHADRYLETCKPKKQ